MSRDGEPTDCYYDHMFQVHLRLVRAAMSGSAALRR